MKKFIIKRIFSKFDMSRPAENNAQKKQAAQEPSGKASLYKIGRTRLSLLIIFCWMIFAAAGFYFSAVKVSGEPFSGEKLNTVAPLESLVSLPPVAPDDEFHNAFVSDEIEFPPEEESGANIQDFSRFSHTNRAHASISCLMCHRRDDNSARPRFPGHSSCIGCHAPQFSDPGNSRICVVCHTAIGSSNLKAFPPLRSFNAKFSHVVHNRRGAIPREGCATCHRPAQRGMARSIPARLNAHETCFQCHTNRARAGGRDISSCGTCHSLGRLTRTPETARAFRLGFSHGEHTSMSCSECHQVRAGGRGNQVTSTVPAMHFPPARAQSCATCHNNQRAFGGNDFSDCKRCHEGNFGF